jgi:hypothetical protein
MSALFAHRGTWPPCHTKAAHIGGHVLLRLALWPRQKTRWKTSSPLLTLEVDTGTDSSHDLMTTRSTQELCPVLEEATQALPPA